jgi:hypothetical protein
MLLVVMVRCDNSSVSCVYLAVAEVDDARLGI